MECQFKTQQHWLHNYVATTSVAPTISEKLQLTKKIDMNSLSMLLVFGLLAILSMHLLPVWHRWRPPGTQARSLHLNLPDNPTTKSRNHRLFSSETNIFLVPKGLDSTNECKILWNLTNPDTTLRRNSRTARSLSLKLLHNTARMR